MAEEVLFPMLPGNVLTRSELEEISKKYDERLNHTSGATGDKNHIFCKLYTLGLLGYVKKQNRADYMIQSFASPGETPLNIDGIVPMSDHYLIHPILYERIARYNTGYFDKLDPLNIVGRGRPWRSLVDVFFVLRADVVRYSEIMASSDLGEIFPMRFSEIVERAASKLSHHEITGGDSLLLIDRSPYSLLIAAESIMEELKKSIFQRHMRFGGDAGIVRFDTSEAGISNLRGGALRVAARLEAVGAVGKILVTDRFKHQADQIASTLKFFPIDHQELPKARVVDGRFNLAKNDDEEAILHSIYHCNTK